MKKEPTVKGRKQKQPAILRQLRQEIMEGRWQPGERLPSRGEFEISTGVSRVTVQKIFDKLSQEGFIEVNGRRETRVATDPPHLSRYALCFPHPPTSPERWNRFWSVLSDVSLQFRRKDGSAAVEIFHSIDGHTDVRDYTRLLTAARHHLVAGMIFPGPADRLLETPLMQDTDLPKVLIARPLAYYSPRFSVVTPESATFYDKACAYLKLKGCKTVALLMPGGEAFVEKIAPSLERHELDCPPYWLHRVMPESSRSIPSLVHLMMRHPDDRPDGLIIADDHFTGPATQGLLAAGVRVPDSLHVVVHENFPAQSQSLLPFKRVGFDVRQVLRACTDLIDEQRKDGTAPRNVSVSALYEDQLTD
jgi:DNA-binding LacI/PurR family transcriptional regulator